MSSLREKSGVERWPEHPQKESSDDCESDRVFILFDFNIRSRFFEDAENQAGTKSEVSSKSMNDSTSSNIINVDKFVANDFIQGIENDLDHGHEQKLIGSDSSQNSSKSDKNRGN